MISIDLPYLDSISFKGHTGFLGNDYGQVPQQYLEKYNNYKHVLVMKSIFVEL